MDSALSGSIIDLIKRANDLLGDKEQNLFCVTPRTQDRWFKRVSFPYPSQSRRAAAEIWDRMHEPRNASAWEHFRRTVGEQWPSLPEATWNSREAFVAWFGELVEQARNQSRRAVEPEDSQPVVIDCTILISSAAGSPFEILAPEILPVSAGQRLRIEMECSRSMYLSAFWITPDSQTEPLYPWEPGRWDQLPATLPGALDQLSLPLGGASPPIAWRFQKSPGLETLVVVGRKEPLSNVILSDMALHLSNLPKVRKLSLKSPGPFYFPLNLGEQPSVRLEYDPVVCHDPILERHSTLRNRLKDRYDAGLLISLLNRG